MEIIVDPGSIGSLHEYFCGKTKLVFDSVLSAWLVFIYTDAFLIDFSTRFGLTRPRQNDYIETEVFEKRLSQKENFKNSDVPATHSLLGENRREHRLTSVNSLGTKAYRKIRRRLSSDCCKNKCVNAGTLSLISIRSYSTPLGG